MGCGMSRYGVADVTACSAFHNLVRKKFNATADATPSTKFLLKDDCDAANALNGISSAAAASPRTVSPVIHNKGNTVEKQSKEELGGVGEKGGDEAEECKEEDGGEGERISNFDRSSWIGSPSFREYCRADGNPEEDHDEEKKETRIKVVDSSSSPKPSKETPSKSQKEERKGRRLRKLFPSGLMHVNHHYHFLLLHSRKSPSPPPPPPLPLS